MKTQKIFFHLITTVFVLLSIFACRNEVEVLNNAETKDRLHDKISFKTFQQETKIVNIGDAFDQNLGIQKNDQQQNSLSEFIIDTANINRIKANSEISTYAFRIYSIFNNPQDLYNLIYRKRNNGSVHYSILKIESTKVSLVYDSEKKPYLNKAKNNSTYKSPCTDFFAEFFHCKNGKDWEHCDHCSACVTTVNITYGDCSGGGGGGESSGGGWIPPSNPPSGSNNNSYEAGASTVYYTDPSGYVFDPNIQPTIDPNYLRASYAYYFWSQLEAVSTVAKQWASENPDIYQNLIENYLNNYSTTNNTKNLQFHNWAIQFLMNNSTNGISDVSWTQFQNWFINPDGTANLNLESWFITKTEGIESEYTDDLDNILSTLQYQTKPMPTYSQFVNAFPKLDYPSYPGYYKQMPASQVYPIVGGTLESLYNNSGKDNGPYRNACTVRWSLGMNGAGILIPNNSLSRQGANVLGQPRYYYLQAKTAGDFMQKTFGSPNHKLEGTDANNSSTVMNFLKGKTGIYVIVNNNPKPVSQGGAGYTGHVDLIQNGHIPGGSNHENVPGGIKSIRIWEFTP